MSDPLEALQRAAAQDTGAAFRSRVEKEHRKQTAARTTRRALRWSILVFAILGFALYYSGEKLGSIGLQLVAVLCFLVVVMLGTVLFFMGGIAPDRVRRHLSERQKRLLDD